MKKLLVLLIMSAIICSCIPKKSKDKDFTNFPPVSYYAQFLHGSDIYGGKIDFIPGDTPVFTRTVFTYDSNIYKPMFFTIGTQIIDHVVQISAEELYWYVPFDTMDSPKRVNNNVRISCDCQQPNLCCEPTDKSQDCTTCKKCEKNACTGLCIIIAEIISGNPSGEGIIIKAPVIIVDGKSYF